MVTIEEPHYFVRGTLEGDRIVAEPLCADSVIARCFAMREAGYCDITITNIQTGHVANLSDWWNDI